MVECTNTTTTIKKDGLGYIDAALTQTILPTVSLWKSMKLSPNWLTTLGLICSITCLVLCYQVMFKQKGLNTALLAVLFLLLRMYFDYADGLMARCYDMTSKIGGWYDHVVDIIFGVAFAVLVTIYDPKILFILVPLYISTSMNMGCIEKRYERDNNVTADASLSLVSKMCPLDSAWDYTFRIFDNGFLYLAISIIIIYISTKHPKK